MSDSNGPAKKEIDPTANLAEQLVTAVSLIDNLEGDNVDLEQAAKGGARLAKLVLALDDSIQTGGSLPDQWQVSSGDFGEAEPTLADPDGFPPGFGGGD